MHARAPLPRKSNDTPHKVHAHHREVPPDAVPGLRARLEDKATEDTLDGKEGMLGAENGGSSPEHSEHSALTTRMAAHTARIEKHAMRIAKKRQRAVERAAAQGVSADVLREHSSRKDEL